MAKVDPPCDYVFKILMVGDSGVGKTCLLQRFVDDFVKPSYIATIGIDYRVKTLRIDDDIVKLEIWDTAGQERFRTLTAAYFRGAMGILLVYDVTNSASFDGIPRWIRSIQEDAPDRVKILLLGNKTDLDERKHVESDKAEKIAFEFDLPYMETSALANINVEEAFVKLARLIKQDFMKMKNGDMYESFEGYHSVNLSSDNSVKRPSSGCC
eukprot:m.3296 g.3296  ORF g.3296 m.3296 type:complete len:211 (+) comp9232_c0_seq1:61-693(+)